LLLALFVAFPAFANITSSSLTGRVTIGDTPASGVTVSVSSLALQGPRATTTNAHGRYWLDTLPPGVYDVTFSLAAHTTLTKRAVLELARVARADGALEPNPDEDSTTSTAATVSVADTIPATTHFDDASLDRFPTGRGSAALLAPGGDLVLFGVTDGIPAAAGSSGDTIEQLTVVRGAAPVEWETYSGAAIAIRTRSGGEDFVLTLRDTITNTDWTDGQSPDLPAQDDGLLHFGEATAGGRIVPQRLWFFAGAWRGESAFPNAQSFDGLLAKIDAQLASAHHLDVSYRDATQSFGFQPYETSTASLRYTGVAGPRFTSEVIAARRDTTFGENEFVSIRGSYVLGDHVVTAGFSNDDGDGPSYASFHASDRWSFSRWNVYAGLRHDDSEFTDRWSPRVAVAYDVRDNGRQAISASWGEYAVPGQPANMLRILTLGYASAIGNSGAVRVDGVRRENGAFWQNELQLDARYRLFDRFEAGATYTLMNRFHSGFQEPLYPEQIANVWLGAEVPVGAHEFGVTLLQRASESGTRTTYPTDVALRYAIPFSRFGLLIAADGTNVFVQGDTLFTSPRALRFWLRVRL
jgi:hypothetical protein